MAAPIGNKYYLLAEYPGRKKIYETSELLWDKACQYFKWIDENPITTIDYRGKDAEKVTFEHARPYTLQGLCLFLNITVEGFKLYEKRDEFVEVTRTLREIIYSQKFEGASAGIFQHNIIARDLGLIDKKDHTTGGEPIKATIKFSDDRDDAGS